MKSHYVCEDEAYTLLAHAVVRQAAKDYQKEYRRSKREGNPTKKLIALERWFKSSIGMLYTSGTSEIIMDKIQKGVPLAQTWGEDEFDYDE